MCMVMRGVEKAGTTTVSNTFLGSFETDKQARSEYFSMIK
jgi:GTP cyclohydrolase I